MREAHDVFTAMAASDIIRTKGAGYFLDLLDEHALSNVVDHFWIDASECL